MAEMKPILFSTEMVRAILEGRKTVTRRVVKTKDIINAWDCEDDGTPIAYIDETTGGVYPPTHPCPYRPGDILYVRETFFQDKEGSYHYKADDALVFFEKDIGHGLGWQSIKWRPSIHMPKEAARIFMRVTDVRVERLQDITEEQAEAEGLYKGWQLTKTSSWAATAKQAFMWVWDMTIKPVDRALYGWAANPWVWVIAFERISREEAGL